MTATEWTQKAMAHTERAQSQLFGLEGEENEALRIGRLQYAKDCIYNASKAIAAAIRLEWEAVPGAEEKAP